MKQHDGSVVKPFCQFFVCRCFCRLVVFVPVNIGKTPEHRSISQLFCHTQIALTVLALRRSVEFLHIASDSLFVLYFKSFFVRYGWHIRMSKCMITYYMPFLCHSLYKLRFISDQVSHYKKRRLYIMFFKHIKYMLRISVVISCIKGQIYWFFFGISHIICIEFF